MDKHFRYNYHGFLSAIIDFFSNKCYVNKSRLDDEDDLLNQFHGSDEAGENRVPGPDGDRSMKQTAANSKTNQTKLKAAVTGK